MSTLEQPADWLTVARGDAPLIVSLPHTGTLIPEAIERTLVSPWLARKDADWWIDKLYGFARDLGATIVHTAVSRTVIDVNRDPSGVSLYPGQATTGLCPVETFDGEPLYRPGQEPDDAEIERRRHIWFAPYHAALAAEIARLRALHPAIVVYDAHSIRSLIPRLFEGELPQFNIGTNMGASCAPELATRVAQLAAGSGMSWVANGRFKGGWITRSLGKPDDGVHAIQMELACRGYMLDPDGPLDAATWPTPWDADYAEPVRRTLAAILDAALAFARSPS